jgi:hypothetical protein
MVALSKAFALAAARDAARAIREEVGFFQAIRAALVKRACPATAKRAPLSGNWRSRERPAGDGGADTACDRLRACCGHQGNVTVDWMHRDSARANIRRHVKRLLRKYGYPPDLQDAAVQNVLQQAEALSAEWAA